MKVFSLLIFLFVSIIEVRVRAATDYLQNPEGCFKGQGECFLSSLKRTTIKESHASIHMLKGSVIQRMTGGFRFLNGTIGVSSSEPVSWKTLYGEIRSASGDFILFEKDNKIFVQNLSAVLSIQINGQDVAVPPGFELWLAGKDDKGLNIYAVPSMVNVARMLSRWKSLEPLPPEIFKEKITLLKSLYKNNHEFEAGLYQKIADRHIASIEQRKREELENERKRKEEARRVKQLYYERVFER